MKYPSAVHKQMSRAKRSLFFWVFLVLMMGTACIPTPTLSPSPSLPMTSREALPSDTPFSPIQATVTPQEVRLWISPEVPVSLRDAVLQAVELSEFEFEISPKREDAQLFIEPNADVQVSNWIYALVTAFPTLEDEISSDEFRTLWEGKHPDVSLILMDDISDTFNSSFGPPVVSRYVGNLEALISALWDNRGSYSVIPFQMLDPRLKVLRIDGLSPLNRGSLPEEYPLQLSFGVSGEQRYIDHLFPHADRVMTNRDPSKLTVVVMTGVTALVRATAARMQENGVAYPGLEVANWLMDADLTHISHEVSFAEDCPPPDPFQSSLRFCSDPDHLALFEGLDVDLVELSGNHLLDWGVEAFLSTLALYSERDIQFFAAGSSLESSLSPLLVEHNGNQIAFLGCNAIGPVDVWASEGIAGVAPCEYEIFEEKIRSLREEGVLPIFTFQWAEAKRPQPLPLQVEAFRRMVDAGAVIVSGSQAHRPQTLEFYRSSFIHYGLGNLFFDQMQTLENRQEFIDRHVFYEGRHINTELLTALLEDYAQPRPMTELERKTFLDEMFKGSGW